MSLIRPGDPDFRICRIDFGTLVRLQIQAEERGWSTRWSSVEALRGQVKDGAVLVQSFMRQQRGGGVEVVRCLVLASTVGDGHAGGVATLDVDPAELAVLDRLDRDPDVRAVLTQLFTLASGGIVTLSKE